MASHSPTHPEFGDLPTTFEPVSSPDSGPTSGPRHLLRAYDLQQNTATANARANADVRRTPPVTDPGTGFSLLIDYKPVQRTVPVTIEGQDTAASSRLNPEETGNTTISSIGASMKRISDNTLAAPDLRIVVRNDRPAQSLTHPLSPSDLRVIDFGTGRPADQNVGDLVDRLTGEWESSFFRDEDDTVIQGHSDEIMSLRSLDERRAKRTRFGSDMAASERRLDVGPRPVSLCPATGTRGDVETSADVRDARRSTETVRLFENYLPIEMDTDTMDEQELTFGARQAVMNVVRELRHLKRTGGAGLSFSLRLHPEYLGRVEIDIQRLNDVWTVSMIAAHDEARDVLTAEISRLENRFPRNGLALDSIIVLTRELEETDADPTGSERSGNLDLVSLGQRTSGQLQILD